jgi:hypothetical protein
LYAIVRALPSRRLTLSGLREALIALAGIIVIALAWHIAIGSFIGSLRDRPVHYVPASSFDGTDWEGLTGYISGQVPIETAPMIGGPCFFVHRPEINFFALDTPMRNVNGISQTNNLKLILCAMTYTTGGNPLIFPYPWFGLLPSAATILLVAGVLLARAPSAGRYLLVAFAMLGLLFGLVWGFLASMKFSLP